MLSIRKSEDVEKMDVDNDFELNDMFVNNSSIFFHSFPENTQNTTKKLFYFPLFSSNFFFFPQKNQKITVSTSRLSTVETL